MTSFKKLFVIFFLLSFLLHSHVLCAESADAGVKNPQKNGNGNGFKVFQTLPPEKVLRSSPQFAVVDDFNDGKLKNKGRVSWRTKAPGEGALDMAIEKHDGRNPKRGYSLKLNFNLVKGEEASLLTFSPVADVSQAKYFVFKYLIKTKEKHGFKDHLRVVLSDWRHREASYMIPAMDFSKNKDWHEAVIPISQFKGLDLDHIFSIRFDFLAGTETVKGTLWIDEIAFFGFNNVAFESTRDNLTGYPKVVFDEERRQALLKIRSDKELLLEIAKDTWKYFENARDQKTSLLVDHIGMGENPLAADYTSITNIAMDLLSTIAAMDLKLITEEQAEARVGSVLDTLQQMAKYRNFFYNYYRTRTLMVERDYVSTVDSGWLALALVVVRQTFKDPVAFKATRFLDAFDFNELLDPENNQLVVGLDVPERNFGLYHYGMLVSEARATSLYAIGKGDIPEEHWWFLFRTPPEAWNWQNQKPRGKYVKYDRHEVFEGYYEYGQKKFVPSWGGSMFEFLMPTLVIDENEYAPKSLGRNNRIATEIQRDYALKEKKYPVWGISPAAMVDGRRWKYLEYGVKTLAVKGYVDHQVVTPHASFLALATLPDDAVSNIRKLLHYNLYGEYGLYDSLNLRNDKATPQYLALDQGMSLVDICNHLEKGSIRKRFHKDPIGKKAGKLLSKESFF